MQCMYCTLKSDQQNPAGLTDSQERLGCGKQSGNLYIRTLCAPSQSMMHLSHHELGL